MQYVGQNERKRVQRIQKGAEIMKNTIIAILMAYVYQSVCVETNIPSLVAEMLLVFWLTKEVLKEIDRKVGWK